MPHVLRLFAIAALALFILPVQAAEHYPQHVVRIVNPYPAGGSVDLMARILAQRLSDDLGQQFIVENRSGGGGNTGSDSVAKAEPDGYTLLFTAPGPLTVNQTLYSKLSFDPAADFAPIALFATAPIVLMVYPGVPASNAQELIALARKEPGKLNFASAGNGTTNHLSGEMFKSMAKVDIVHVPYRGAPGDDRQGARARDGGRHAHVGAAGCADHRRAGRAWVRRRVLVRHCGAGEEAKTPEPVLATLREEVAKALKAPDMIAHIRQLGSEPGTVFGKDFGAFMVEETKKWAEVIRASGAKAD
jgi:tripartite-type tricarboxylate transporter receptor subunit TctC